MAEAGRVQRGGYKQANPPEDDCCPICFDSFSVPCKTDCGHWFCASCILRHWRYGRYGRTHFCHCPLCDGVITKLEPHTSSLNQPGEDISEILKDVKQYNRLWITLLWTFLKRLCIPSFSLMRRRYRETLDEKVIHPAYDVARFISCMLLILYCFCGFDLPFEIEGAGFIWIVARIFIWIRLGRLAVFLFFSLDAVWYEMTRERARRQAEAAG